MSVSFKTFEGRLNEVLAVDRKKIINHIRKLTHRVREGKPHDRIKEDIESLILQSTERFKARFTALPFPQFPENLPVNEKREEIARAISSNQVVIVCGETGSGKTTQ